MTSHDDYPVSQNPQVEFLPQDMQRLEAFAGGLQEKYYHSAGNGELLQNMVESQIDGDVIGVQAMPEDAAVKLIIEAAALGATRVQGKAQGLHEMVQRSPLLSQEDKGVISAYASGVWGYRSQGLPEGEIAVAVYRNALGDVARLSDEEDKSALRLAIMAFTAGVTVHEPDYYKNSATALIDEARRHAA